jgi:hypothetical protein
MVQKRRIEIRPQEIGKFPLVFDQPERALRSGKGSGEVQMQPCVRAML